MSVPKNLRDELLSAFLDGEVTADERARVEQLLQSDGDARDQYERLRQMRRGLGALPKQIKLPDDFAARVLQAAFAEATREGLTLQHPLRIAAERGLGSSEASSEKSGWRRWGWGALVASIAASGLFGAFLIYRGNDQGGIAKVDSHQGNTSAQVSVASGDQVPGPDGQIITGTPKSDVPATTMLAQDANATNRLNDDVGAGTIKSTDAPLPNEAPSEHKSVPMIASNTPNSSANTPTSSNASETPKAVPQRAPLVMLVEVRVKQSESELNPIATVLERAGIGKIRDVAVDDAVVSQLAAAKVVRNAAPVETVDANAMQIIVVQSMARKIDQVMVDLYGGVEGVSSVGLSLALDSKLTRTTQHVAGLNPVVVQHGADSSVVSRLVGSDTQSKWFRAAENGRKFSTNKAAMSLSSLSNTPDGTDIPAAMILMVRYE